jgi:hypothetical protein
MLRTRSRWIASTRCPARQGQQLPSVRFQRDHPMLPPASVPTLGVDLGQELRPRPPGLKPELVALALILSQFLAQHRQCLGPIVPIHPSLPCRTSRQIVTVNSTKTVLGIRNEGRKTAKPRRLRSPSASRGFAHSRGTVLIPASYREPLLFPAQVPDGDCAPLSSQLSSHFPSWYPDQYHNPDERQGYCKSQ